MGTLAYPTFPVYDSEYVNIVSEQFLTNNIPHSQGPKGGDPFSRLRPGEKIVFDPDLEYFKSIEELFEGRTGTAFSSDMNREFVRRFLVEVKNVNTVGPSTACSCPGVPLPFAPYIPQRPEEWDYQAVVVNISAAQKESDDWSFWIVTVRYSTQVPAGGPTFRKTGLGNALSGPQVNPWEEPPSIEADVEIETEVPNQDLDGRPYSNSAEQPFTPPYSCQNGYRAYTLIRNERVIDFENRPEKYIYVVNSTPFKGYAEGYSLCTGGRGQKLWRGMTPYYRVTYKILCKDKNELPSGDFSAGWQPRILNAGMFQRKTLFGIDDIIGSTMVPIAPAGIPVTQPVLLNEFGQIQETKYPGDYVVVALQNKLIPIWLNFRQFRSVELNDLLNF